MEADSRISADSHSHVLDVCPDMLGQVGHLVHETDLGSEHRVGSVLGQFAGSHIHDDGAIVIAIERRVEVLHELGRLVAGNANDDAVRLVEIGNSSAFFQELRIGHYVEFHLRAALFQRFVEGLLHAVGSSDGHC